MLKKFWCKLGFHCWHTDYNKPFTWEDIEKTKSHGSYKPADIYERVNPPPPPPRPIPAGYMNVCCHCNKVKESYLL